MEKDQPSLYHDGFSQPQSSANNEHDRTDIGVPLRVAAVTRHLARKHEESITSGPGVINWGRTDEF
jgi:hypothetical protein